MPVVTPVMLERHLEELTLNAWPALASLLIDGWVVCLSDGYTRRANSIHPLYPSTLPLDAKIAACEAIYAQRGQATIFKLTDHTDPPDLDAILAAQGYAAEATTSVQLAELVTRSPVVASPRVGEPPLFRSLTSVDDTVTLSANLEDAWFADFNRLSVTPERFRPAMNRVLQKIAPPHAFAAIALNGLTVAQGLAVVERGYVGLFDIIVDAKVRNQGLGRRLCTRLLEWARTEHNATHAYLAVMADNAPALALYANLGFQEQYRYWYRLKR